MKKTRIKTTVESPYLRQRDWGRYFDISESEADRLSKAFSRAYLNGELEEDDLIKGRHIVSAKKTALRKFYARWKRRAA